MGAFAAGSRAAIHAKLAGEDRMIAKMVYRILAPDWKKES